MGLRTGFHAGTVTLAEVGIEKHQSHRWQRIASLDAEAFERYLAATKAAGQELTSAGVQREARQRQPPQC
jgi:hypothetical protein